VYVYMKIKVNDLICKTIKVYVKYHHIFLSSSNYQLFVCIILQIQRPMVCNSLIHTKNDTFFITKRRQRFHFESQRTDCWIVRMFRYGKKIIYVILLEVVYDVECDN